MAEIKKISTELQLLDKFLDTSGDAGTSGQVLTSTGTGINWVSGGSLPGGPYLPLTAGSSYPLTGDLYLDDDSGASPSIYFKNEDDNFWRYLMETGGDFSIKEGTSTRLTFQADGNVGIGVTAPLSKLHVNEGNISIQNVASSSPYIASGKLRFLGRYNRYLGGINTVNTGSYAEYDNGLDFYVQRDTFDAAGHFAMRINHLGNVGIGTTSPLGKLQVNEYTVASQGNQGVHGEVSVFANDGDESLFLGLRDSAYPNRGWAFNPVAYGVNSSLQIKEHGSTAVRMTIQSGGNVGIGTTSPDYKFEAQGVISSADAGLQKATFANVGNDLVLTSNADATNVTAKMLFNSSGAGGATVSTKMIIDGYGNVGIGTTSPDTKLEVRTDSGSAFSNSYFRVTAGASGAYGGTAHFEGAYNDYGNVAQPNIVGKIDMASEVVTTTDVGGIMKFFTKATGGTYATAPIERMRINSSGNVGIGDASPTSISANTFSLSVNSSRNDLSGALISKANGTVKHQQYWDSSGYSFNLSAGNFQFGGGNVGIGTTNPGYELSVNGNIEAGKNVFQDISSRGGFIMRPWGADYLNTQTNVHTGAIKITLPTGAATEDDMIKFTVDIYQYVTNESLSVDVGGYIYRQAGINDSWRNVTAIVNAKSATENYTVRFGDDGTNHCIWIGELNTVWNHPNVICRNFYGGFEVETEDYLNEWDISFEATSFSHVSQTQSNNFPLSSGGIDGAFLPLAGGTMSGNIVFNNNVAETWKDNAGATTRMMILNSANIAYIGPIDTYAGGPILYGTSADVTAQVFYTGASPRMRITSAGNVGIGVTAPDAKLHIADTNKAINSEGNLFIATTDDYAIDKGGQISLGGVWHSTPLTTEFAAIAGRKQTAVNGNAGGYLQLSTSNSSGGDLTEKMRITSAGNVGIGTDSPDKTLTVGGTNTTHGIDIKTKIGTTVYKLWEAEQFFANEGYQGMYLDNVKKIQFRADGDSYFVGGDVGIGTTSPGAKLDVVGKINQTTSSGGTAASFTNSDATSGYGVAIQSQGTSATRYALILRNLDGSNVYGGVSTMTNQVGFWGIGASPTNTLGSRLTVGGNASIGSSYTSNSAPTNGLIVEGNVGIGTDSPGYKLEVAGTARITSALTFGGNVNNIIAGTGSSLDFKSNGEYYFRKGANTNLTILSGGNVGIGTTSPNSKLDVRQAGDGIALELHNTGGNVDDFVDIKMIAGNTTAGTLGTILRHERDGSGGGDFSILTNPTLTGTPTEKLIVKSGGNVGINNSIPNEKLSVRGNIELVGEDVGNCGVRYIKYNCPDDSSYNVIGVKTSGVDVSGTLDVTGIVGIAGSSNNISSLNVKTDSGSIGSIAFETGAEVTGIISCETEIIDFRAGDGISMSSARVLRLTDVNAIVTGTCTATNFILSSDKTLKDKIKDIATKHINIEWKNFELISEPGIKRSGVIAQELEIKHPEFVRTNEEGLKSVAYIDLLIAKIAELEARLEKAGI